MLKHSLIAQIPGSNRLLPDGKAGIGYNDPEPALEISSHVLNENNPSILFSTGEIPIGGSGTNRTVKAYIALLDNLNTWRYMWRNAENHDFLIKATATANNIIFSTESVAGYKFFTHGTIERMRMNHAGFLGLGSKDPRDILHLHFQQGEDDVNPPDPNLNPNYNLMLGAGSIYFNCLYDDRAIPMGYKNFDGRFASMQLGYDEFGVSFKMDRSITSNTYIFSSRENYDFKGLRITSDGSIGICNQAPVARLDIKSQPRGPANIRVPAIRLTNSSGTEKFKVFDDGFVACSELKVAIPGGSDWPDYVFTTSYKLTPLSEVETFINNNGHLPGIPSTKDIEENKGIEVGALQVKLLEKIEELTLHVIQLKKELEETKNKLLTIKGSD
ncbi:MAG: hypothetical protein JNJ85_01515 [Candidatus Kapabacteria bacterium]|nr:hypothetical protein [Candidatus Kapabacteria bacterium]